MTKKIIIDRLRHKNWTFVLDSNDLEGHDLALLLNACLDAGINWVRYSIVTYSPPSYTKAIHFHRNDNGITWGISTFPQGENITNWLLKEINHD